MEALIVELLVPALKYRLFITFTLEDNYATKCKMCTNLLSLVVALYNLKTRPIKIKGLISIAWVMVHMRKLSSLESEQFVHALHNTYVHV